MNLDYAYICENDSIERTYLYKKSKNLACYLRNRNIERVIIYGHKNQLMFISIVACIIGRIAYVICDTSISKARIDYIIKDSNANLVLCTENMVLDDIECISSIDMEFYSDKYYEKLDKCIENDIAYQIYTSGSTGYPKGIKISYNNINNFLNWFTNFKIISEIQPKIILNQALFSFDLSVLDIYYSLWNKSLLFCLNDNIMSNFNLLFCYIKKSNAEMAVFTPSFLELCLCDKSFNSTLLPNLKIMFLCGEVLKPFVAKKFMERFIDVHIINAYGPSEATCCVSAVEINEDMTKYNKLPIGDMNNCAVEVKIIDSNGVFINDLSCGEIVLSGKSVSKGYTNYDNKQFKLINNKIYYYTGDLGHIENGMIYFDGRIDNQIKYKGYRIELDEIENTIYKIRGVEQVQVCTKLNTSKDVIGLMAYVVCADKTIDEKYIYEELSRMLPKYSIPKSIVITNEIPLNSNRKRFIK
ncbi:AMP-binding protein [Sedimentibacter sp. zth1]|uniref:AMP-binding protein n=1 Tax=Sedimentibacter sp. zth1 TaxID=2816908 RepID=UPI001A9165BA|nr:AMP-binding protein [Sedimentibacter sp. zth1]QSX06742.1 AMP-binding protein [Sedimentibacter sp. zth1]